VLHRFADYAAQDKPFDFTQEDIPDLRRKIAVAIMNKVIRL
jgi:Ulp1 family protease